MKINTPIFILSLLLSLTHHSTAQEYIAKDNSRQINLPDNQGTVNINQYLVKSDDYKALTKQLEDLGHAIEEKMADCKAFEAMGNAERLAKCRQSRAAMQVQSDSLERIITLFKDDVLRLAQTFQTIPLNSERLRVAKALFDEGKFREVLAVMNTKEMMQEGEALLLQKERLESSLEQTDSLLQIKAEEFLVKAQAKAIDYADPKRIDSTTFCYRQSLRYADEVQTLYDLALFFSDNHLYDSAFAYFPKVIAHPKAVGWQVANASSFLGNMHTATGDLPTALDAYTKFFESYEKLHRSEPDNSFYKNNLAISYEKLGSTHTSLGNLEKALQFFEDDAQLTKELYEAYPQNVEFKNGLAISYVKLATIYLNTDMEKAIAYLKEAEKHFSELYQISPQNAEVQQYLQIVQSVLSQLTTPPQVDHIAAIEAKIRQEQDTTQLYHLYTEMTDTLRLRCKTDPTYTSDFAQHLNSKAWYGFFLGHFAQNEQDIREAMSLGTENKYLATNLPPALLLQGKKTEALAEYQKWKDLPFGEQGLATYRNAYLDDLKAFEAAGIIPAERQADVEEVRALLGR